MQSIQKSQNIIQSHSKKPIFTIFHFNDVYDIQMKKDRGGICNFKAKLQQLRLKYGQNTLTLFSGDAMSPSILSNTHLGWQMVKALNSLGINAACYGNHQFDYFEDHTIQLTSKCNFPWLLGNIKHIDSGRRLGNGQEYKILVLPNNIKVGIFGVAGQDWISIMNEQYEDLLQCQNVNQYCKKMSYFLKHQQKCDFIVALTHMRNGPDLQLSNLQTDIDIILGGHDHVVLNKCLKDTPVIKSGCNFLQIGVIQIFNKKQQIIKIEQRIIDMNLNQPKKGLYDAYEYRGKCFNFICQIHQIFTYPQQKLDEQLKQYVHQMMVEYQKFDKIVGYSQCQLQARFNIIRTRQSNYGNFFIDLFRLYHDTDIAFLNSGCIRNDARLPAGPIHFSVLSNIIDDQIVVKLIPGNLIKKMLEYAVSGLPNSYMGSFLFVSGIKFTYDLTKTPRIQSVQFNDSQLSDQKQYSIAMPSYMGNGGDGFDFIKPCTKLIDQGKGISIMNLLLKFFSAADLKHIASNKNIKSQTDIKSHKCLVQYNNPSNRLHRIKLLRTCFKQIQGQQKLVCINPIVDNRIICLNKKQ